MESSKKELITKALSIMHIDSVSDKGDIKNSHLMAILDNLISTEMESYDTTLSKLTLSLQMDKRRIRENYLEGMEAYGIIEIHMDNRKRIWRLNITNDEIEISEGMQSKKVEDAKPYFLAKRRVGKVKDLEMCNHCGVKDINDLEACIEQKCKNILKEK